MLLISRILEMVVTIAYIWVSLGVAEAEYKFLRDILKEEHNRDPDWHDWAIIVVVTIWTFFVWPIVLLLGTLKKGKSNGKTDK